MFSKQIYILKIFLISLFIFHCGPTAPTTPLSAPSPTVIDFAGEKISLESFNQQLEKNHGGKDGVVKLSSTEKERFFELYLAFRLKVKDAYSRGYDKDPEVIFELNEYKKNLAVSYMLEKELVTPQIQKYYSHQIDELRASHILINIDPNDTLVSYNKALSIIDTLNKKLATFEELVLRHSQDPSSTTNKGDLYFFTAGSMVPEFEEAAFSMKLNETSNRPVKSEFGYHILRITDKQKNRGKIQVSHIMKSFPQNCTAEDSLRLKNETLSFYDSLRSGISFEDLASKYSDDTYSKTRGGDLGMFARRSIIPQFEDVAFKLKKGELSGLVVTPFGYHIIKLTDEKQIPSYKEAETELRSTYQQMRYPLDLENLLKSLKSKTNYRLNDKTFEVFKASLDTTKSTADYNWDSSLVSIGRSALMTIGGEVVTIDSFVAVAKIHPELRGLQLKENYTIETMMDKISQKFLLEYEARKIEKKYPEFANLMKEYEEGILLFKVEQEEVWNKLTTNPDSLKVFWGLKKENYIWPDRVRLTEIFVSTDSLKKIIAEEFSSSVKVFNKKTKKEVSLTKKPITFDSAAIKFNQRPSTLNSFGRWELLPVTTNELTIRAWELEVGGTSEFFPIDGGFSMIRVDKKDSARLKTFEEASSEVSSLYQEHESNRLRNDLVSRLKKKYNPTIATEVLKQVLQ